MEEWVNASPCPTVSAVGSEQNLRIGGRWLDPRLGQYSFQGSVIVIATGFIPHSPLSIVLTMVYVGKHPVAWKEHCAEYWLKRAPGKHW